MLQEYVLKIGHVKGKENVIAYCLLRVRVYFKKVLQAFFS